MDLVERDFNATRPNELWVSDLTYIVARLRDVAFVIDVFARLTIGERTGRHRSRCVGAGAARAPTKPRRSIGASQRSRLYAIRYTERAEAGS